MTPEEKKEYNRLWRLRNPNYKKEYRIKNLDRINQKDREYKEKYPDRILESKKAYRDKTRHEYAKSGRRMLNAARQRAKTSNLPFDLTIEDIVIPTNCPLLGIPLVFNLGGVNFNSPTLDKKIPELGYVKGNVCVISHLANRMKGPMDKTFWLNVGKYMGWSNGQVEG